MKIPIDQLTNWQLESTMKVNHRSNWKPIGNLSNWNQLKQIEIKTESVPIENNGVQWGPMDFYGPIYPLDQMDQLKPIEVPF